MRCKNVHRCSRQLGYLYYRTTDEDVFGCMVCLHVYVSVKRKVEAIFHLVLWSDILHDMIWYDDTGPIIGWVCVKNVMTEQAEDSTVIWHLREGAIILHWREKRWEREWVKRNEGRWGKRRTGRVMPLKDIKMRKIVRGYYYDLKVKRKMERHVKINGQ